MSVVATPVAPDVAYLKSLLGVHPDFPLKGAPSPRAVQQLTVRTGIVFLDIFPILQNPVAFESLITHFMAHLFSSTIPSSSTKKVDVVVGLDARFVNSLFLERGNSCSDLVGDSCWDRFWHYD